jgi:murein L,D-transpeptidase YcbB/YkuD
VTPAWFRRELVEGDTGDDVLIVQRKLCVPMTGVMDQTTMSRIRGFQKKHGLEESGTMTQKTANKVGDKASKGQTPEWFDHELCEGDSGDDVAELRKVLGLPAGKKYDLDVANAVRRFQAEVGINTSGCVEEHTAVALADRLA